MARLTQFAVAHLESADVVFGEVGTTKAHAPDAPKLYLLVEANEASHEAIKAKLKRSGWGDVELRFDAKV